MTNEIRIFENQDFGKIRVVDQNGGYWFVANDIAGSLGYVETAKAVREHCKGVSEMDIPTRGGIQTVKIIPESDVYRLIMRSKKPDAEKFQDWVCGEVLPSVRKHGVYMTPEKIEEVLLNPDTIIRLAMELKMERKQRLAAEKKIEQDKPKVNYFDTLVARTNNLCLRDTAKELGVKEKWFIQFLLMNNYLYRDKNHHLKPYSETMDAGIFVLKEWVSPDKNTAGVQTLVTIHGREILMKKITKHPRINLT